jgi:hypothetical protein
MPRSIAIPLCGKCEAAASFGGLPLRRPCGMIAATEIEVAANAARL